jgi:hypothetical protein
VFDRAEDAVLVTAASLSRSPGRAIVSGGQFVARFTTPSAQMMTTCHPEICERAAPSPEVPSRFLSRYHSATKITP